MRIENTVTKILAAMLWCVVSVGCVAKEVQNPTVSVEVSSTAKDAVLDESVAAKVDAETGEKYQELKASFVVDSIKSFRRSSSKDWIIINNYLVEIVNINSRSSEEAKNKNGKFYEIDAVIKNKNEVIGKTVSIFCKKIDKPKNSFNASEFCTLYGNKDYFVSFK